MKHMYLLGYVIISMIISGCEKQTSIPTNTTQPDFLADSAVHYLKDKLTPDGFMVLNTNSPNVIKYQGESKAVRIFPKDSSIKKFILLYLKNDKITGHWVDLSHISKNSLNKYTGTVSLFDLQNKLTTRYTIKDNNVTAIYDGTQGSIDAADRSRTLTSTPENPEELDAFVVTPKPLDAVHDYYSAYWMTSWEEALRSMYIPDFYSSGGGGASISVMEAAPTFPSPKHPIENIKEELKCFTVDNKAVYSVSINVNQPKPGTRNLVNMGSDHEVGHAYLTLQEQLPNGSKIIRNVGFYPKKSAKPGNETDQSIFGDDSDTPYSVSLKIDISASEFSGLQANIYNQKSLNYNLDAFNCTTAVVNSFSSININIPATMRHSFKFDGIDPADLGQDIRQLDISTFSKDNGGRKVVRNLRNENDVLPPAKTGMCK